MPANTQKPIKSTNAKPSGAGRNANAAKKPSPQRAVPAAKSRPAKEDDIAFDQSMAQDSKGESIKIKDMLSAVAEKSGTKKPIAKKVTDAFLEEIAEALTQGKTLNLSPLGKLRVVKMQEKGPAKMLVVKLRMGQS
jgi:hypothetical protein